jgi:drug/metabolite transporter (DMT)-like permease
MTTRERILAYLAFATLCLVWGTSFVAIKVAIETVPSLFLTGGRFTLAGVALLAVCAATKQRFPAGRGDWLHLGVIGLLMIGLGNVAIVWGEHFLTSGATALLIATGPFWMGAVERVRPNGRRFTRAQLIGMVIAFLGVAVLAAPELRGLEFGGRFLLGALAIQLACLSWAIGSVRSKYWPTSASPLVSAAVQMIAGGGAVLVLSLLSGEISRLTFTPRTLLAYVHLTVFGSIAAYSAYVFALSKLSTAAVALSDYIIPGIAVVLGWLILQEPLTWRTVAALALILAGVAFDHLVGRRQARRDTAGEDARAESPVSIG